MYFIVFLFTTDFLALNILSAPAGNANSACSNVHVFERQTMKWIQWIGMSITHL